MTVRITVAAYRLLLRALPRGFRSRFEAEMAESFDRRLASRRGVTRARFVARAFADVMASIVGEWARLRPGGRDALRHDLRAATRALRHRPGFASAVVVTLALGVGANAAVFSLVDAVLLRPLPIADPDRVVAVFTGRASDAEAGSEGYGLDQGLSYSAFRTVEAEARSLSAVAGFHHVEVGVRVGQRVSQLAGAAVSGGYFTALGVQPSLGRLIVPSDDRPDAESHVVVLSDGYWRREFGAADDVIGRTLDIGGTTFIVIGVAPPGFRGTRLASQPEIWLPIRSITAVRAGGIFLGSLGARMLGDHPLGWVSTLGRLADGVTTEAAGQELASLLPAPAAPPAGASTGADRHVRVVPIVEASTIGDRLGLVRFIAIMAAVVGLTLVIACLNVANLSMVRTGERARELSLRAALGASRARLTSQLLVEHAVLAGIGGLAALGVGVMAMRLLSAFTLPGEIAIDGTSLGLDVRVFAFVAILAVLTSFAIGLVPAIRASRTTTSAAIDTRTADRGVGHVVLVTVQVALTLVLLVGAGLFVRSLRAGFTTDLGFDPAPVAGVSVDLFRYGYDATRAMPFYDQVLEQVAALPDVEAVALTTHVPIDTLGMLPFDAPDGPHTLEDPMSAGTATVTAGYFDVMGIPIVAGREFTDADARGSPRVAILSEAAARQLFPGRSPIGREVRIFGELASTVVGVAGDAKYGSVRDDGVPMVYGHLPQNVATGGVSVVVRSSRPAAILASLRAAVQAVDPGVALYDARLVADQVGAALAPQRFGSLLLSLFAAIALAVAAVGIYGVVAATVSRRTAEIGIRVALGASTGAVIRAVLARTGLAVAAGAAVGLAGAVVAARALERFLFGIPTIDPVSFMGAAALLALAAGLAILRPARLAATTDPLIALRRE